MVEEKAGTKRLTILEAEKIESVYGLTVFVKEERAFYFVLASPERAALSQLHGVKSIIYFILQLSYFKARRQFFVFNLKQVAADAQYISAMFCSMKKNRPEHNRNLQKAGQVLKLFTDDTIAPATPFDIVQTKAFAILQRQKLAQVANHIM